MTRRGSSARELPATVEQFTVAALERLGGAAEEEAPGLFTVLWPAQGMTDVETRRLAFDPEALDEAPDAELVTFASPSLEEVVRLATASGQVARAFLNAVVPPSRKTAELLARSYRFMECAWSAASRWPAPPAPRGVPQDVRPGGTARSTVTGAVLLVGPGGYTAAYEAPGLARRPVRPQSRRRSAGVVPPHPRPTVRGVRGSLGQLPAAGRYE